MNTTKKVNNCPILWTKDFILVFISNLLLFFSFYMLVPILPFYVIEELGTSESLAGVVLSVYTIAALLIRPFSGFLVDTFSRKPLYLLCYAFFCLLFAGYTIAITLFLFIVLRIFHGFAFGISTVSGSTVAVDIMPSERRGEGIGYYGMAANIAMATGPFLGLWLYNRYSFDVIFIFAFIASLIGFITIVFIKPIKKIIPESSEKPVISLDRFILVKALPCIALLLFSGVGYGAVSNFIGLYCEKVGMSGKAGIFFLIFAAGIVIARLLSAKAINKGKVVRTVYTGSILLILVYVLFSINTSPLLFYVIALLSGAGYGYITPAFQSMFINLAYHNQRGTANATYFIVWDMGIGLGIFTGGFIIDKLSFAWLFILCAAAILIGLLYFRFLSAPYFERNKLR